MEDDPCVFASCLAAARVHEPAYVWKHRKAIAVMTTAASLAGNLMTLFLYFKNSAVAAMQYFFLMLVWDPPRLFIFCLVMLLLLIILAMSGPFDDDGNIWGHDIARSSIHSLFDGDEDVPHAAHVASRTEELNHTDFMNESSIHIDSTFYDEFDNVPMRHTRDIPCRSETAQERFEVKLDVMGDEDELIAEWKREKLIFTGRLIPDDEDDEYERNEDGLDELYERAEAFIRRVRMGFSVER